MNLVNFKWKEDTLTSILLNSRDMSPQLDTGLTNQPSLKSSSRDCPAPLPKHVWKWTTPIHGMNGKCPHINDRRCTYDGVRFQVLTMTGRRNLPRRKTSINGSRGLIASELAVI